MPGSSSRSIRSRARSFPRDRCRSIACGRPPAATCVGALAQLGDERLHARAVVRVLVGGAVDPGLENGHYERPGSGLAMGIAYARIGT